MDGPLYLLTLVTALGCGLSAGALFAFSSFVMKALASLPPAQGVAAMNAINVMAVTFAFMLSLFGTGLLCVVLAVWALTEWGEPFAPHLLAGSLLYVVGVIGVTMVFNVPRNNALARVEPASAAGERTWERYVREWTAGNHVRTVAGLAAAAALTIAIHVG